MTLIDSEGEGNAFTRLREQIEKKGTQYLLCYGHIMAFSVDAYQNTQTCMYRVPSCVALLHTGYALTRYIY
jgi:hypothetical protein